MDSFHNICQGLKGKGQSFRFRKKCFFLIFAIR